MLFGRRYCLPSFLICKQVLWFYTLLQLSLKSFCNAVFNGSKFLVSYINLSLCTEAFELEFPLQYLRFIRTYRCVQWLDRCLWTGQPIAHGPVDFILVCSFDSCKDFTGRKNMLLGKKTSYRVVTELLNSWYQLVSFEE